VNWRAVGVNPNIADRSCDAALRTILAPVGLTYGFENGKVVLKQK